MKGPRELKRYMSVLRSLGAKRYKQKNGVVPTSWLDDLKLFKLERCKKWYKRNKLENE